MPPTLGITRPARHRPSGHKLSRPPMPQGLSACPQRPTRPGPARGQHNGDRPRASAPASARPRNRPAQRSLFSQPGTAPPELQQYRDQPVAAEPGPPRSQRHHERAGRPQPPVPRLPKLAILRQPINRRPCPSGTPYSAGRRRLEFGSQSVTGAVRRQRASSRLATAGGESPCRADLRFCHNPPEQLTSASAAPCSAPAHSCEPTLRRLG